MKILKFFSVLFALYIFMIPVNMVRFDYNLTNAFWRTTLFIFEGTIWAPNYSEVKFNQVKLGDTKEKVISLMGKPIVGELDCLDNCFWRYTRQDTGTADFDQRAVLFNNKGVVEEVRKDFYID